MADFFFNLKTPLDVTKLSEINSRCRLRRDLLANNFWLDKSYGEVIIGIRLRRRGARPHLGDRCQMSEVKLKVVNWCAVARD